MVQEVWLYYKAMEVKETYKAVVIEYSPKAENMSQKIEEKANEILNDGYVLVTITETTTAKAILIF